MTCTIYPVFCQGTFVCFVLFQSLLLLLTVLPWTHCSPLCSCTGVSPGQWIPMLRAYENHLGSFENHQCSDPTSRGSLSVHLGWGLRTEVFYRLPHDFNRKSALRCMSPSTDCFHASIPSAPTNVSLRKNQFKWHPSCSAYCDSPPLHHLPPPSYTHTQNHSVPLLCARCLLFMPPGNIGLQVSTNTLVSFIVCEHYDGQPVSFVIVLPTQCLAQSKCWLKE